MAPGSPPWSAIYDKVVAGSFPLAARVPIAHYLCPCPPPFSCYAKQTSAIREDAGVCCVVGLDRTWRILSLSLSLSLCSPVVEKELMVVRATGQYVGAEGDGGHATEGGIVQGAPLNSIPGGNSREDKRWADANRREPPGRRSMLMARARPDGLPSPLNMYRRVLYLRSLPSSSSFRLFYFHLSTPERAASERMRFSLFLSPSLWLSYPLSVEMHGLLSRSSRRPREVEKRHGATRENAGSSHRIRLRAVSIRRRLELARFVSERVCWTFVDESNWRNERDEFGIEETRGIDARQL